VPHTVLPGTPVKHARSEQGEVYQVRRVVATAVTLIGVLAVAGCSGSDPQPAAADHGAAAGASVAPPVVTASPTVSNLNDASLPLDRYTTTVDEYIELDYASKLVASDCMKRFGIDWSAGSRLKLTAERDRSNRLGLVDEAEAARFGYHADPVDYSPRDNGQKLTDTQAVVLFGTRLGKSDRKDIPDGGCIAEGRREVGWNVDDDVWLQTLANDAGQRTFADKRSLAVMADWSACMKQSGYRYDKPEDASQDKRWWKGSDDAPATTAEKNTAVADVRCKKKINYVGKLTTILVAYQQQIVESNVERLESAHRQVQEALKKAAVALSGH
jgi:hypothetical protein